MRFVALKGANQQAAAVVFRTRVCWFASAPRPSWCGWRWPTRWPGSSGRCWREVGFIELRLRRCRRRHDREAVEAWEGQRRGMAHGQETGSGKPALRQALQARGPELDLIHGLPSGPAAWNAPQQRPNTCQHPTTCHTAPEDFSCSSRGVHTCRKLWRRPQDGLCPTPGSRFVNLWETETEREQPVLLAHGPRAGKAETLTQPQHRLEALDGPPRCVKGLETANPRHGPLDPEVIALDPLLEMFGDVMRRRARQQAVFPGCGDRRRVGPRPIGADPVRGEQRLVFQRLAEEALGGLQVALRGEQEVDRV